MGVGHFSIYKSLSTHPELNGEEIITAGPQVWGLQQLINAIGNAPIKLHVPLDNLGIAIVH